MNLALDTNAYSDFVRQPGRLLHIISAAEGIYLPFVVLAELRAGFSVGSRREENEHILEQFLSEPDVYILYPDEGTISHYADLYRELKQAGKKIPQNDLWIAAIVVQHHLTLCTRDAHFDYLPRIARI